MIVGTERRFQHNSVISRRYGYSLSFFYDIASWVFKELTHVRDTVTALNDSKPNKVIDSVTKPNEYVLHNDCPDNRLHSNRLISYHMDFSIATSYTNHIITKKYNTISSLQNTISNRFFLHMSGFTEHRKQKCRTFKILIVLLTNRNYQHEIQTL